MKKLIVFGFIQACVSVFNLTHAQINFEKSSWEEIKAKALEGKKLIFMDAYTTWCGPCKWMEKNVFSNDTVGNFFNSTFVNAKMDMESEVGIELAKRYNVKVYPTLLILDGNGDLVHRTAGALGVKKFVEFGEEALRPEKRFSTLEAKFKNGERSYEFVSSYLKILGNANLNANDVLVEYLASQPEADWQNRKNWNLMYAYLNDYSSKPFQYLMRNEKAYAEKYTTDSVSSEIFDVFYYKLRGVLNDSVQYAQRKEEIRKFNYSSEDELFLSTDLSLYELRADYDNFSRIAVPYLEKYKSNDAVLLNNIAYIFYEHVKNKELLAKAEKWAKKAYELDPNPFASMETYASVLYANGKNDEAVAMLKKAIEIIEVDPVKYNSPEIFAAMKKNLVEWSK